MGLCVCPVLAQQQYTATWVPSSGSGVSGTTDFSLSGDQLTVHVRATGVEPGQIHPVHLHGFAGGRQSVLAPPDADTRGDSDSYLESFESELYLGSPLLPLTLTPTGNPATDFSTGPGGVIDYSQTYTINPAVLGDLTRRAIQIHGLTVPEGIGAGTPGEVNGSPGYKVDLPIAAANIVAVPDSGGGPVPIPLPPAVWTGAATMVGLVAVRAARRRFGGRT